MRIGEVVVKYDNGVAVSIPVTSQDVKRCLEEALAILGHPVKKPKEYKWDFDTLDNHAKKQEEPTMHVDFYADLTRKAREEYEGRDVSIGEVHDEMVEVMEEGMERRIVPDGGTIPLLVRKKLKNRLEKATCTYYIKQLEKMLERNMNDCLGI